MGGVGEGVGRGVVPSVGGVGDGGLFEQLPD